jgi:hypothetical protein
MGLRKILSYVFPWGKRSRGFTRTLDRVNRFLCAYGLAALTNDSERKIKIVHLSSSGYDHGRRTLYLNPGDAVDSILAVSSQSYLYLHETGHFFLENILPKTDYRKLKKLFGNFDKPYDRDFEAEVNERSFVSYYATVHPMDDFAETFAIVLYEVLTGRKNLVQEKNRKCRAKLAAVRREIQKHRK